MKKRYVALVALLFTAVLGFSVEQGPIDLVVVMDTSSSMSGSYRQVSEYAIGPMLKDFLRVGDTFHLIGFSSVPKMELSRQIEGSGDIETIVARMLLLYPIDPYSDVIASLEYVSRYLADLPENRGKTVVFISDGEHSPSPSSPYAALDDSNVSTKLSEITSKLKGNGWQFFYLKVPFTGAVPLRPLSDRPRIALPEDDTAPAQRAVATKPLPAATSTKPVAAVASSQSPVKPATRSETTPPARRDEKQSQASSPTTDGKVPLSSGSPDTSSSATTPEAPADSSAVDVSGVVSELLAAPVVQYTTQEDATALASTVGAISAVFPADIGNISRSFTIPITLHNPSAQEVFVETHEVLVNGKEAMGRRSFRTLKPRSDSTLKLHVSLPKGMALGAQSLVIEPEFSGGLRINPQSSTVQAVVVKGFFASLFSFLLPALLFLLGLTIAVLLTLLIVSALRKVGGSPVKTAYSSHYKSATPVSARKEKKSVQVEKTIPAEPAVQTPLQKDNGADLLASFKERASVDAADRNKILPAAVFAFPASKKTKISASTSTILPQAHYELRSASERIMLSLFVEDQNTAIGKRNVHLIKAGATLSVGGGHSDFLVFLVPLPDRIADLHFDGERCILVPRRPDFFPDTGASAIEDCIGKTIRLISQKGYILNIRFDRYEDPLVKLNSFLHSIELPNKK